MNILLAAGESPQPTVSAAPPAAIAPIALRRFKAGQAFPPAAAGSIYAVCQLRDKDNSSTIKV